MLDAEARGDADRSRARGGVPLSLKLVLEVGGEVGGRCRRRAGERGAVVLRGAVVFGLWVPVSAGERTGARRVEGAGMAVKGVV